MTAIDDGLGIVIRPWQPADQAQVRALHDRTPPAGNSLAVPQPWPPDLDQISAVYLAFWVAVEHDDSGERVVGIAGIVPAGSDVPPAVLRGRVNVARLQRMRVAPERQRQGIGSRLTEAAVAWAHDHGFSALILETTPQQTAAISLYRRQGFSEAGCSRLGQFELVWFELPLAHPAKQPEEYTA